MEPSLAAGFAAAAIGGYVGNYCKIGFPSFSANAKNKTNVVGEKVGDFLRKIETCSPDSLTLIDHLAHYDNRYSSYGRIVDVMINIGQSSSELNQAIQDLAVFVCNTKEKYLSDQLSMLGTSLHLCLSKHRAEDFLIKSLKLIDIEWLVESSASVSDEIPTSLFYLAEIYFEQGRKEQAKDFYVESLLCSRKPISPLPFHLADIAREKVSLLGGDKTSKFNRKLRLIGILIVMFPILVWTIESGILTTLVIVIVIVIAAIFATDPKTFEVRIPAILTIRKINSLMKKWNIN